MEGLKVVFNHTDRASQFYQPTNQPTNQPHIQRTEKVLWEVSPGPCCPDWVCRVCLVGRTKNEVQFHVTSERLTSKDIQQQPLKGIDMDETKRTCSSCLFSTCSFPISMPPFCFVFVFVLFGFALPVDEYKERYTNTNTNTSTKSTNEGSNNHQPP